MSEIIVYTHIIIVHLAQFVKNYLNEHHIDFEERNINNQQYRNEMIDLMSFNSVYFVEWQSNVPC